MRSVPSAVAVASVAAVATAAVDVLVDGVGMEAEGADLLLYTSMGSGSSLSAISVKNDDVCPHNLVNLDNAMRGIEDSSVGEQLCGGQKREFENTAVTSSDLLLLGQHRISSLIRPVSGTRFPGYLGQSDSRPRRHCSEDRIDRKSTVSGTQCLTLRR